MAFDAYTLRARVLPGVIATLPMILLVSLTVFEPLAGVVPAVGGLALAYWASEFVRQEGVRQEARLKRKWGGMPTTSALRYRKQSDPGVTVRRRALEQLTGRELPSAHEEDTDPDAAEQSIERLVKVGIAVIRQNKIEADVLQQENTSYGFRRNLRALKSIGLLASLVAAAIAIVFAHEQPVLLSFLLCLDGVIGLLWLAVVRDGWVYQQAEKYAERFFIAIETAALKQSASEQGGR